MMRTYAVISVISLLTFVPAYAQNPRPAAIESAPSSLAVQKAALLNQAAAIEENLNELRKVYKENYPDIRSLKMQLATLRDQVVVALEKQEAPTLAILDRQIAEDESRLSELHRVYKETYPDIRTLEIQLQTLRDQRNAAVK